MVENTEHTKDCIYYKLNVSTFTGEDMMLRVRADDYTVVGLVYSYSPSNGVSFGNLTHSLFQLINIVPFETEDALLKFTTHRHFNYKFKLRSLRKLTKDGVDIIPIERMTGND